MLFRKTYYSIRTSAVVRQIIIWFTTRWVSERDLAAANRFPAITAQLKSRGYAVTNLEELFLKEETTKIRSCCERKINELRRCLLHVGPAAEEQKSFLARLSHYKEVADISDPIVWQCLDGVIVGIAEDYLETVPKITNIDYWINFPVEQGAGARSSQKWHRDYEDQRVLKLFVYLSDVGDETGPFFYVPESHKDGRYSDIFPVSPPLGVVVEDDVIDENFSLETQKKIAPRAGTVVLVDTAGLHKGGFCISGERQVFTASYTTHAGISSPNFNRLHGDVKALTSRSRKVFAQFM